MRDALPLNDFHFVISTGADRRSGEISTFFSKTLLTEC